MPIIPPDPGNIARALREQLEQIRILIAAYPLEPAYPIAAEHVEAAISKLEAIPAENRPITS